MDGIVARTSAIHAGAGLSTRLGTYVRGFLGAGAGPNSRSDATWRIDAALRFHLDPFRESRWAPYAGGGVSVMRNEGDARPWLLLIVGLEGPLWRGVAPAFEVGAGGGARIGLALRAGKRNSR